MIGPTQTVAFAPDVVLEMVDGDALLLKLREETFFSLNTTGARVAQLISEGRRFGAILDTLVREYGEARSSVERDVNDLLESLRRRGLIVIDPAEAE